MIIKKSIKQLLRTPITTIIFVLLFSVAALFFCTGAVIWARNQENIKNYEDAFMTVGRVSQRSSEIEIIKEYDSYSGMYRRSSEPAYDHIVSKSTLEFDGADYIIKPEHRPFYGAWCPELIQYPYVKNAFLDESFIIEFSPLTDCIPSGPVEVRIVNVVKCEGDSVKNLDPFAEYVPQKGKTMLLCDHWSDSPQTLYAGKVYIACVRGGIHNKKEYNSPIYELYLQEIDFSTLYTPDGERIEDGISPVKTQEVTDGFYETESGRRWLAYADSMGAVFNTIPVIPTGSTALIPQFYNKTLYIIDGEDISRDEYENGERVCLVPSDFAELNNLKIGDSLRLPLYFANYKDLPSDCIWDVDFNINGTIGLDWRSGGGPLNAEGEKLAVFSDHEYVIKGIYNSIPSQNALMSLGRNTVIIPSNSVTESDENNIIAFGPMQNINTSFQIPNGSIEKYMEKWLAFGNDDLQFTFYDRGYTQVQRGMENMKRISTLFLAVGGAMTLALVLFFCNLCISKNKPRTAIERMLGYTKKQSAKSLISGFMLAAIIAAVIGCGVSIAVEDKITDRAMNKEYYNTDYTIGAVGTGKIETTSNAAFIYCPAAGVVLILVTYIISNLFVRGNLKEEPLLMLGKKME